MISETILEKLIAEADDIEKDMIKECLESFEEYHEAVYRLELIRKIGSEVYSDDDEYKHAVMDADRSRTIHHNSLISDVGILNRMCANHGMEPIYDGVVSEERPYRRELANSVFEYIEKVIRERS